MEISELTSFLESLKREHHYCEDTYYSCPMHPEGCPDPNEGPECNCGADRHNLQIDSMINHLQQFKRII